jgi:hypothetical protein
VGLASRQARQCCRACACSSKGSTEQLGQQRDFLSVTQAPVAYLTPWQACFRLHASHVTQQALASARRLSTEACPAKAMGPACASDSLCVHRAHLLLAVATGLWLSWVSSGGSTTSSLCGASWSPSRQRRWPHCCHQTSRAGVCICQPCPLQQHLPQTVSCKLPWPGAVCSVCTHTCTASTRQLVCMNLNACLPCVVALWRRPPAALKTFKSLSAQTQGHVLLLEYLEERPLMMLQTGMGMRLTTYYRCVCGCGGPLFTPLLSPPLSCVFVFSLKHAFTW